MSVAGPTQGVGRRPYCCDLVDSGRCQAGSGPPPAWLHNPTVHPLAEAQVRRTRHPVTARAVYPTDPDYERLLARCDHVNGGRYTSYRQRTSRPIPVVALTSKSRL